MEPVTIKAGDVKPSIADVLPILKKAAKDRIPTISNAAVVCDGERVYLLASDRYVAVRSVFHTGEELPTFRFFASIEALEILKSRPVNEVLHISENGFVAKWQQDIELPGTPLDSFPDLERLIDGAWNDKDYFTPAKPDHMCGCDPLLVKHIKDVIIIPRLNNMAGAWRIQAKNRVEGVIMPRKLGNV